MACDFALFCTSNIDFFMAQNIMLGGTPVIYYYTVEPLLSDHLLNSHSY